ncbi:MAG: hypothetical protein ACTHKG_15220 [Nocardioides sp.]
MVNQSPREHSSAPDERLDALSDARPDGAVARLLDAAAAPVEAGPQPGEEQALAAFRASHRTRRIPMFSHPTRAKAAVAATIGAGTLLFAGVGGAAAGVLPDPAQDTASTVLGGLGFDVPRADEHAGDHPAQRGAEEDGDETEDATDDSTAETDLVYPVATVDTEDADATGDPADPEANDHGQAVSGLAQDDTLTGADKGAAVSELASGGKSKAAEDHGKPEQPGSQADSHKPAAGDDSTDEQGDADEQDSTDEQGDDSSDHQADGSSTAHEKSGGHSDAGSQHARP